MLKAAQHIDQEMAHKQFSVVACKESRKCCVDKRSRVTVRNHAKLKRPKVEVSVRTCRDDTCSCQLENLYSAEGASAWFSCGDVVFEVG